MSEDNASTKEFHDPLLGYDASHFVRLAMNIGENTEASDAEMIIANRMNAALEAAFLIAAADGELTDVEIAALSKAAAQIFQAISQTPPEEITSYQELPDDKTNIAMNEEYINASLQSFADLLDDQSYAQRIAYIAESIPSDEMRQQAFMLAVDLAMIDGQVPDDENTVIHELAAAFAFDVDKTNSLLDRVEAARKAAQ
jgi:tellurite resistance protein